MKGDEEVPKNVFSNAYKKANVSESFLELLNRIKLKMSMNTFTTKYELFEQSKLEFSFDLEFLNDVAT